MSVDKFGRYSSGQSSAMAPGASARYVNNNFLRRDGSNDVQGELNMNNHKLVGLTEPTESQDAATRGYIKNFTRNNFLKLDGTNNMAGGLDLNNNKITNVADPTEDDDAINKRYLESATNNFLRRDGSNDVQGEISMNNHKIVNLSEPTEDDDATTKQYVDSRKPLITIWAQENGPLNSGENEWSFGSGDLYTHANCGFCMPASGRIIRGSLSSVGESGGTSGRVQVKIIINGNLLSKLGGHTLTIPARRHSHTTLTRIPLAQNDRINFMTGVSSPDAVNTIVSLLIELDL